MTLSHLEYYFIVNFMLAFLIARVVSVVIVNDVIVIVLLLLLLFFPLWK